MQGLFTSATCFTCMLMKAKVLNIFLYIIQYFGVVIFMFKVHMCHVMGDQIFAYAKTETQISCAVTPLLIWVFVSATQIV